MANISVFQNGQKNLFKTNFKDYIGVYILPISVCFNAAKEKKFKMNFMGISILPISVRFKMAKNKHYKLNFK